MAIDGGEVKFTFTADNAQLLAQAQQSAAAVDKMNAKVVESTNKAASAVVNVTEAEKKWIAQQVAGEAALKSRSESLGLTSAQVRKMDADLKATAPTVKKLDVSMESLATSSAGVGSGAERALKALGPLGGVVSRLDPEIGAVFSSVAGLTSGIEGLGAGITAGALPAIGALGVAAGAAGVVFIEFTGVIDDYTDAERRAKAATDATRAAMQPLGDAVKAARKERDLLLETLNAPDIAAAAQAAERQLKIDEMEAAATADIRKEREDLAKIVEKAGVKRNTESLHAEERIKQIDRDIAAVHSQGAEYNALQGQLEDLRKVTSSYTGEAVQGSKDRVEGTKEEISFDYQVAELRAKMASEQAARQEMLDAQARASEAEGRTRMEAVEKEQVESAKRIADAKIEEAQRAADEQAKIDSATVQGAADIAGAIASIARTAGDSMTEEQKDAAMAAWAVQLGAATAQVALDTVQGVSAAAASAPPPYNAIPIGAALAIGAANEAAVLATPPPNFGDTPTVMQMQQGGPVNLAAGDFFAAAKDPRDLARQTGQGASDPGADYRDGGNYAIVGARAYGRRITDDVRQRTPLSGVLSGRRDRPLGQRA